MAIALKDGADTILHVTINTTRRPLSEAAIKAPNPFWFSKTGCHCIYLFGWMIEIIFVDGLEDGQADVVVRPIY